MQTPNGTYDVYGLEATQKQYVLDCARQLFSDAGFQLIETPIFEETSLFARGVGQSTDIVNKEMYSFNDPGGRPLTLRPEGTAPVVRSFIQQGMFKLPAPLKVWYYGPFFRFEKPQAGRQRQFNQIGAEVFGSRSPAVEAELIVLADMLNKKLGVNAQLNINCLGSSESRRTYVETLTQFLQANIDVLDDVVKSRMQSNPLRAFDSANENVRQLMQNAPQIVDSLPAEEQADFEQVCCLLQEAGVDFTYDPMLVRGLDYYTGTVFEFSSGDLGAQSGVSGGGRYDELVQTLQGPQTAAVGFAAGVERLLLAAQDLPGTLPAGQVFVVNDDRQAGKALLLASRLRSQNIAVELNVSERSLRGQIKAAMKQNPAILVVIEEDCIQVRRAGQQDVFFDDIAQAVSALVAMIG